VKIDQLKDAASQNNEKKQIIWLLVPVV
jgi:hypothetical protein